MTYLGYQVRHLEDQTEQLNEWLDRYSDKAISVWGKTVVGSGSNYGINPSENPWEYSEIKAFKENGDQCEFCTESEWFVLKVCDFPKDKWGNTATYGDGLCLQEGYIQVGYEDNQYTEYQFPSEWDLLDEREFLGFALKHYPEILSEVGEIQDCNGSYCFWTYFTTNKPFDSQEWKMILAKYLEDVGVE